MLYKVLETTDRTLRADEEWTSAWYEEPWAITAVFSALADQPGEIFYEHSEDGETVLFTARFAVSANIPVYQAVLRTARYFRIRYKNGATPQTRFRCSLAAIEHNY
jgi:hypothetical protein